MGLKPKVFGEVEENVIRDFGGRFIRRFVTTVWRAWCPCHRNGEFALVVSLDWREALDAALEHERIFHRDT